MKKLFYPAAMMLATLSMSAQVFNVGSIDKINTGVSIAKPSISSDGNFVVGYSADKGAIVKINADGKTQEIAKGEGLYNVTVTGDGNSVVFNRPSYDKKHLRKVSLEIADINSGTVNVMVKPSRNLNAGVSVSGSTVAAVENGKMRVKYVGATKTAAAPFASISYGHLQVTVNGTTTTIDPQGRASYIWPSVSPDGKKVVYWVVGGGCYVCNIDGTNSKSIGNLRAAVFAGNDVIIGMNEIENENQQIEASSLIACRLIDGKLQRLTSNNIKAQYPSANADGSKVAFVTTEGELYMISLSK